MIAGMALNEKIDRAVGAVLSRGALMRSGLSWRGIADRVSSGELIRLRNGWYVRGETWAAERPDVRHLMVIHAARSDRHRNGVFSHRSAATLHGLPVWSDWMRGEGDRAVRDCLTAHLLAPRAASGGSGTRSKLHRDPDGSADTVRIAGFACTSADCTLADLAATEPFAVALACADRLLRDEVAVGRLIDPEGVEAWRARLLALARSRAGARGVRALRALAVLADPRAESPLESVSRLRSWQLGLEPELQVPVRSERGGTLYLDFLFRSVGFFGECDGKEKYLDDELRGQRTPDEVFERERRRHNWASGVTRMNGVRWGVREVVTVERFATHLRAFGVPFPGRAVECFGPEIARFLREAR